MLNDNGGLAIHLFIYLSIYLFLMVSEYQQIEERIAEAMDYRSHPQNPQNPQKLVKFAWQKKKDMYVVFFRYIQSFKHVLLLSWVIFQGIRRTKPWILVCVSLPSPFLFFFFPFLSFCFVCFFCFHSFNHSLWQGVESSERGNCLDTCNSEKSREQVGTHTK